MASAGARRQVQAAADTLLNRSTTLVLFDENLASADWTRFRGDLTRLATAAGADFLAALQTHADITPMLAYDMTLVDDDSSAGVPTPTIPQIRQHTLLCVLRQGLSPAGESMRLIEKCEHAGGRITDAAGITIDQAMIILDRRRGSSPIPKDGGLTAKKLHSMNWPSTVSVDAYMGDYNSVVSAAASIGMNPPGETDLEQQLRGTWWYVFARPSVSSPYYSVAVEARTVTRQEESTMAHRESFRDAMVRAISNQVAAGATSAKHTGRVVGGRYGALLPGEVIPPSSPSEQQSVVQTAVASTVDQKPQPSPFGGSGFRRCPKCPQQPDGSPTQHPSTYRCAKACECDVCHSDRHLSHACFIKHGVPYGVKLQADMLLEIRRLHELYKSGSFDWASTPRTSLKWLLALRRTKQIPVAVMAATRADCGTWELRPASECYAMGKEPIGCMWVYDCKIDATTLAFMLWRARLVARGDQMVFMRDYLETYSGVVKHSTWRLFLAVCAQFDLVLTGSDVSTAYLHAPLRDYVVWMKQPRGFVETIDGQPALCRLKMALYGLKQSAREWAITVIAWLTSWGFKQCVSDRE